MAFAVGCTAMPTVDTMGKRMAVFEITYSELVRTAEVNLSEGRLDKEQAVLIDQMFKKIDTTRLIVYEAWNAGDTPTMNNGLEALNVGLSALRAILIEAEKR